MRDGASSPASPPRTYPEARMRSPVCGSRNHGVGAIATVGFSTHCDRRASPPQDHDELSSRVKIEDAARISAAAAAACGIIARDFAAAPPAAPDAFDQVVTRREDGIIGVQICRIAVVVFFDCGGPGVGANGRRINHGHQECQVAEGGPQQQQQRRAEPREWAPSHCPAGRHARPAAGNAAGGRRGHGHRAV